MTGTPGVMLSRGRHDDDNDSNVLSSVQISRSTSKSPISYQNRSQLATYT